MGERVPVEDFLRELDFSLKDNTIGAGHPAAFDFHFAVNEQIRKYVMRRFRKLLAGQRFVNLPDATDDSGNLWRWNDEEDVVRMIDEWDTSR